MIPLPDPDASPGNPSHINAYPEFTAGSTVMALYPDTSCFYRAEVIQGPRDQLGAANNRVSFVGYDISSFP
jgi:SAGA-associated factor 29